MYQVRKLHTGLIACLCLLLLVSCTWASVISVPELTFQSGGEIITRDILLDNAPDGISGYNITLSLADPEMGQLTAVTFPEWAGLKSATPLPESFVIIRAVDTGNLIERNSTGILLAQVSVTSKGAGSTSMIISVKILEDDEGNPVSITVPVIGEENTTYLTPTTIPSATTAISQSGGGTGGSGSGISYAGTGSVSGSVAESQVITSPVPSNTPSNNSQSSENSTAPESPGTIPSSTSPEDTHVPSADAPPTKAPFILWTALCALFCAGIIVRARK